MEEKRMAQNNIFNGRNGTRNRWLVALGILLVIGALVWVFNPAHVKERTINAFAAAQQNPMALATPTTQPMIAEALLNASPTPAIVRETVVVVQTATQATTLAPTFTPVAMAPSPATNSLGNGTSATQSECNASAHSAQIKKVNDLISSKGLEQALKELGVTGSLNTLTDQDTYAHEGNIIVGIKFYPASNLKAPWPMVIASPNTVTGYDAKVDLGGGNAIYKNGTLANGGGVLWFSGLSYPEFCGAQPSGSSNTVIQLGNGNIDQTTTFTGTGRLDIQPNTQGRHVDTAQAKIDLKLDVQRLNDEMGDAFVRRITGVKDATGAQMTEMVACPSGYICTVTHPGGTVLTYIGQGEGNNVLMLREVAMTARVISSYPGNDAVYYPCQLAKNENTFGLGENPAFPAQSGNFACNDKGQFVMIQTGNEVNDVTVKSTGANDSAISCPMFGGVQLVSIENGKACKLKAQPAPITGIVPDGFSAEYWDGSAVQQAQSGASITTGEATFRQ